MAGLPLVGDEFAGYRVRAVLGRGGMSVVYQAENLRLKETIEQAWDDAGLPTFLRYLRDYIESRRNTSPDTPPKG